MNTINDAENGILSLVHSESARNALRRLFDAINIVANEVEQLPAVLLQLIEAQLKSELSLNRLLQVTSYAQGIDSNPTMSPTTLHRLVTELEKEWEKWKDNWRNADRTQGTDKLTATDYTPIEVETDSPVRELALSTALSSYIRAVAETENYHQPIIFPALVNALLGEVKNPSELEAKVRAAMWLWPRFVEDETATGQVANLSPNSVYAVGMLSFKQLSLLLQQTDRNLKTYRQLQDLLDSRPDLNQFTTRSLREKEAALRAMLRDALQINDGSLDKVPFNRVIELYYAVGLVYVLKSRSNEPVSGS